LPSAPCETILHEVVRRRDIARQGACIAPQARDLGFDTAIDFATKILQLDRDRPPADRNEPDFIGGL
jgi:hypothetical protein